ncbi:MAG: alpha-amylase [Nitrospiraceae bacterium]|nr:MAG: alpha-amylase [Nitrospiraceae bacterium]
MILMKRNPKLYEINAVAWLYELSVAYGRNFTIGNVPAIEWDRLRQLGFEFVWMMGVWKRSAAGIRIFQSEPEYEHFKTLFDSVLPGWSVQEDLVGSPYSIAAYEPDPLVGDRDDIVALRKELRSRGMGLILDFVPNHTAPDHPWIFEHPDYYIQARESDYKENRSAYLPIHKDGRTLYIAHGKDPYFPPWTDTVQLNHFNPEMRSALIKELKKISEYCDGVRCDMAMLVLNDIFHRTWAWANRYSGHEKPGGEFWKDIRSEIPELLLMAEAYWDTEDALLSLGFDYVYDKRLYDHVRNSSAEEVVEHLKSNASFQEKLVCFIENHDEPRSADVFGREKLDAAAVLLMTLPGMRLCHHGQFEGRKIRLPVQLRRTLNEETDTGLRAFYEKLLKVTKLDVFSEGVWELKDVSPVFDESSRNLIAYTWTTDKALALVVVNLSGNYSQGRISLAREIAAADSDYILVDELHEQVYKRNGRELMDPGLHVILEGCHAHIFFMPRNFSF